MALPFHGYLLCAFTRQLIELLALYQNFRELRLPNLGALSRFVLFWLFEAIKLAYIRGGLLFSQLLLDVRKAHEAQLIDTVPWPAEKSCIFAELHPLVKLVCARKERFHISEAGDEHLYFSLSLPRSSDWKSAA